MANTQTVLESCAALTETALPQEGGACSPRDAALYLAHTEHGQSIRSLAAAAGTHPSTVMRAVRRVEARRDDPLFERVLDGLGRANGAGSAAAEPEAAPAVAPGRDKPAPAEVEVAAKRYLRRLSEPGAFLMVAPGAERGGIFCAANGHRKPIAMLPVRMAAEFVSREWIRIAARGSASLRYRITEVGRAALRRILAEAEEARRASGFAEAQSPFQAQHHLAGERLFSGEGPGTERSLRVNLGESPLGWLARRKGPDGSPFLAPDEIEAGERLRQDFEAAQIGPSVAQDWRKFLTPGDKLSGSPAGAGPAEGPRAARERVTAALDALGPGLADLALRVCGFLEGLEACEKRMGWSARSGKVVLKIALQRLVAHYGLVAVGKR